MRQEGDPIGEGFDATLCNFGLAIDSVDARSAIGRLVALELASYLGLRPARRALATERHQLLGLCASALTDADTMS